MLRVGVSVIPFGPGIVVIDRMADRLLAYDSATSALWHEAGGVLLPGSMLVERWAADGLIEQGPATPDSTTDQRGDATPHAGWASEWICAVAGLRVRFSEQHPRGAALLRNLFRHLEAPSDDIDLHYAIEHPYRYQAILHENGREIARSNDYGVLLGALYQALLGRIHPGVRWRALIHAGVIARAGRAIGLIGPSGSGKSTLLAWMIAHGFDYLADDLMAVAAPDGHVVPWPMPLSIKRGSWDMLAVPHPSLAAAPSYATKDTEARLIIPPAESWLRPPTPLSTLIFPTYVAGGGLEVRPISPFDALVRLLNDRVWIGYPIDEASVRAFLAWLEDVPAFALSHGDVRDAERAIREIAER